jgi:hypothetical protein
MTFSDNTTYEAHEMKLSAKTTIRINDISFLHKMVVYITLFYINKS